MSVVVLSEWKLRSKKATKKELITRYVKDSACNLWIKTAEDKGIETLGITFKGEISRIPSLKNSKLPGRNFTNPDVDARLKAMDLLFNEALHLNGYRSISFGDTPIFVLLVCGLRDRSFDPDNCFASVKDWLEPCSKQVGIVRRDRGWGVGVTNNDALISGMAIRAKDFDYAGDYTNITIRRLDSVKDLTRQYIGALI